MMGVLLIITVLLSIADRLLVSYGKCTLIVKKEQENKQFTVQGGGTLLSALIGNDIKIAAPCGGRGTCGLCKVQLSNPGYLLPTEEMFITKEERRLGTRLACQVKVTKDLQVTIPESAAVEYRVMTDLCKKCGVCFKNCPSGAIKWEKKQVAEIITDKCTKCGQCVKSCKFEAIKQV